MVLASVRVMVRLGEEGMNKALKMKRSSIKVWQKKYPKLVKPFPKQNPRLTKNYARFRQVDPKKFIKGSFRIKKVSPKVSIVLGKTKKGKKLMLQSVLIKRK